MARIDRFHPYPESIQNRFRIDRFWPESTRIGIESIGSVQNRSILSLSRTDRFYPYPESIQNRFRIDRSILDRDRIDRFWQGGERGGRGDSGSGQKNLKVLKCIGKSIQFALWRFSEISDFANMIILAPKPPESIDPHPESIDPDPESIPLGT